MKKIVQIIRQIYESLMFSLQSVVVNKLRTFLSLLGITIGIFAIISVYTAIDSMEAYIRNSFESISTNMLQVSKWPWGPEEGETEWKWWKYANRPEVTQKEMEELMAQLPSAESSAFASSIGTTVTHEKATMSGISMIGGTADYDKMRNTEIEFGRYPTSFEFASGAPVVVVGAEVASQLFEGEDPLGKEIKVRGRKLRIIGIFKKQGENMMELSWDQQMFVPINFLRMIVNIRNVGTELYLMGRKSVDPVEFKAETRAVMRRLRRLPIDAEDNFALNEVSAMSNQLNQIFSVLNLAGGVIGLFSILVGGFGVANIMFVSVKERTAQIGIEKALGAKRYFILLQFTFEAVLLSVVGGVIGLMLIWIGTIIVTFAFDFPVALTLKNIAIGLTISSVIGAVAGIFPAYSAAMLEPVKAISKS